MDFQERLAQSWTLRQLATELFWPVVDEGQGRFGILPVLHEDALSRLDPSVRQRELHTETTDFVRYIPKSFVVDRANPELSFLLEHKVSTVPIRSATEVRAVGARLGAPSLSNRDIGDWERAAYDNYQRLARVGIRVVVMYYCAYHPRPLLADFVQRIDRTYTREPVTEGGPGSGTIMVNFDVRKLRTLAEFAQEELHLKPDKVRMAYDNLLSRLIQELPPR